MNSEKRSLEEILASLEKAVIANEENLDKFDTENGFKVSVTTLENKDRTVLLEKDGLTSSFSISEGIVHFDYIKGPDSDHIDEVFYRTHHEEELETLIAAGKL